MSYARYQKMQETTAGDRGNEYRVLATVTGKLMEARDKGGKLLVEACYYNEKLWTIFQSDLMMPENRLPDDLKARLISLAIWVQKYTSKVIRGEGDVGALIEVNRHIMEGLAEQAQSDPTPMAMAAG